MKPFLIGLIVAAAALAEAWALMICVGVVHSEWLPTVPTLDYESALLVVLAVTLLVAVIRFAQGMAEAVMDE